MMLTPEQLAELRRLANKAVPSAEWFLSQHLNEVPFIDGAAAKFIVAANPEAILHMLHHIEAMQARIAELEAQLTRIQQLADCVTAQNWLALSDEDKSTWFAIAEQRDKEHCKLIAELAENAAAQAIALKAAKAMQQAETERADANEQDAARYRWCKDNPDSAASVFDNLGPAYFDSEIDMLMQK